MSSGIDRCRRSEKTITLIDSLPLPFLPLAFILFDRLESRVPPFQRTRPSPLDLGDEGEEADEKRHAYPSPPLRLAGWAMRVRELCLREWRERGRRWYWWGYPETLSFVGEVDVCGSVQNLVEWVQRVGLGSAACVVGVV